MNTIIIILIFIQFFIKNSLTIECLDFIVSRSDTSIIESVNDKKCSANYCTYVSTEFLLNENNKSIWIPSRYSRECTNLPEITIGNININSLNICKLIYDPNQLLRYYVKICNTKLCNEQCEITSNENNTSTNNNNNNNNINIYIGSNCCDNKSLDCCQNLNKKPDCCNKVLPHWPPLGPQLQNTSITSSNTNDKYYLANFKCCNGNNPQCCNILDSTNICCMMMLQYYKEPNINAGAKNTLIVPTYQNNELIETYDTVMLNNICCKNFKPNCCSNNLNTIPCCNKYSNVMHPGPISTSSLNNGMIYSNKVGQPNIPVSLSTSNKNEIINPFLKCCDEKNPFCCIPVETANSCCLKILYNNHKLKNHSLNFVLNENNSSHFKISFKYFTTLYFFILCLFIINF
uniref:Domain of unknown function DB domain-containing protein n=1 Tax=Strongyloides stercoralis TaxID=6248 RepID=A0A0K0E738_STRER